MVPVHICCARVAAGSHAIVMLDDGAVMDPFKRERASLAHPDYLEISQVIGIWDVRPTACQSGVRRSRS